MKPEALAEGEISEDDESDEGYANFLAKYRTLETLGHGGFSVVKRAQSLETNGFFAVKIVPLSFAQPATLQREIEIMKKIGRHPNILELFDVFITRKNVYIVMELATGGEVFDHIVNHGEYSERDASVVVRQIVEAISYLHKQGIAHRDLKVYYQYSSLIFLFALATEPTLHRKWSNRHQAGRFWIIQNLFTAYYDADLLWQPRVSPEVLQCTEYDHQVDMWSIGVIIYILLTGCFPFWHENVAELYKRILTGAYRWPEKPVVSEEAKDLVSKLLIKDPTKRLSAEQCLDHPWIKGAAPSAVGERNWNDVQSRRHHPSVESIATTASSSASPRHEHRSRDRSDREHRDRDRDHERGERDRDHSHHGHHHHSKEHGHAHGKDHHHHHDHASKHTPGSAPSVSASPSPAPTQPTGTGTGTGTDNGGL
ncbi:calcium calmodulin-dependent kinase [Pelomyxa schiedti]|nr:calcium calmodulin-dependent kinase [Pelomyxa schiedti]